MKPGNGPIAVCFFPLERHGYTKRMGRAAEYRGIGPHNDW